VNCTTRKTGEAIASPVRFVAEAVDYMRSMMVLMPMPAPMHCVARP
jgi:hypothetical protein